MCNEACYDTWCIMLMMNSLKMVMKETRICGYPARPSYRLKKNLKKIKKRA